jgi:hypothetical protein
MPLGISNPAQLRDMVRGAYSSAADHPEQKHAFPLGREFAKSIGYNAELLDSLPPVACDAFAGVSNVSLFAELPVGATVLDWVVALGRTHSSPHDGWVKQERLSAWTSA